MFNLFYVCINLSRCTVIPNSKQISLYVIVRAHKLEPASRALIQRNEMHPTLLQPFYSYTQSAPCPYCC